MINCVAVDDEPLALEILKKFCSHTTGMQMVETFTNPFAAATYLNNNKADLLFLDIQMPELNGIQLYKSLKQPPPVIFTTAFSEYAVEGFNLDALDYLLKPIEYARFIKAVNKATEYIKHQQSAQNVRQDDFIFLKSEYQLVKIEFNDILYFEALDDYVKVITTKSVKPVLSLLSMKALLEKLPASKFVRVHRSYIVPLSRIENVRNKRIKIGEKYIPVGDSYSNSFFEALNSLK
jgi:DNA-binding LytR/AlgR family response regulator